MQEVFRSNVLKLHTQEEGPTRKSVSTNKLRRSLISIWYTNADTLTTAKINELKEEFKSSYPPDIIAITEIKPKNYTRELNKLEYRIEG